PPPRSRPPRGAGAAPAVRSHDHRRGARAQAYAANDRQDSCRIRALAYNSGYMAPSVGRPHPPPAARLGVTQGRILVVDDDESIRRFLATLLTALGHDVACAESGEQA